MFPLKISLPNKIKIKFYLLHFSDYCEIPELISQLQTNYQYWKERDEEIGEKTDQDSDNLPNGTTDEDT